MFKIKSFTRILTVFVLSILFVSCSTISYSPRINLDISPITINKTVQIEKLKDNTPIKDKENPFLGTSVTNKNAMLNELDLEVTNAIISDFGANKVFKQVSRKIENPDYIIRGEINKFLGKVKPNSFGIISRFAALFSIVVAPIVKEPLIYLGIVPMLTWYSGISTKTISTEIEITLKLYDKNNNLIGTYSASEKNESSLSIYQNPTIFLPELTNATLSSTVKNIRSQILNDINKIEN